MSTPASRYVNPPRSGIRSHSPTREGGFRLVQTRGSTGGLRHSPSAPNQSHSLSGTRQHRSHRQRLDDSRTPPPIGGDRLFQRQLRHLDILRYRNRILTAEASVAETLTAGLR